MTVSQVDAFLREAAALAGLTKDELLAKVLHVDDGMLNAALISMDDKTQALVRRLDREIRLRNPGLHYVTRKQFIGYRREGANTRSPIGQRSQIFLSVIRHNTRLDVVLPIDPDAIDQLSDAEDLRGKGHHGVGDVRIPLRDDADIDRLLRDLDAWLRPGWTANQ
jgi:predicted transport protein